MRISTHSAFLELPLYLCVDLITSFSPKKGWYHILYFSHKNPILCTCMSFKSMRELLRAWKNSLSVSYAVNLTDYPLYFPTPETLLYLSFIWFDFYDCRSALPFFLIPFLSFSFSFWLARLGLSQFEAFPPPLHFLSEGWRDKWRWKQEIRNTWFMMYLCQAVRRGLFPNLLLASV